ncbi:methionine ABC transporter ATP-binding protein [Apilactobacillus sp. TMW 2.2459]|uniref:methionine ABC transporter ATP-binding protein n=1 Tax=Apilactobacillus xinyiensis TaxID=2841032 RepID=UPI00200C3758|nr:methionine ABC transporter ATP-binding protein [Apilactobacillus xinyiensis]MCL0312208.1 methionine ABC transporter ATP-binding protein [Apilactobacillus xinyiensis]
MPQISLKNINITFKQKDKVLEAVKNVSLDIQKGDIYGIVGYSGAGKSTLVRVINRLQVPTKGKVIVENQNVNQLKGRKLRDLRHKVGFIFQHFNLMNSRTIAENVYYPMFNTETKNRKARVQKLIKLVGLQGKENAYPAQLSGGQKQRVAIARALANNPSILVSDEATSALDPKTTQEILQLLKKINQELGVTIVLITHEMDVVKTLCNKVAVMNAGQVVEKNNILNIFSNPQNELTKDFINTTNNSTNAIKTLSQQTKFQELSKANRLFQLTYLGESAEHPFIIDLYNRFGISASIIYGNIEFIQGTPLGNLIITIDGQIDRVEEIKQYLADNQISLNEIDFSKIK